MNIHKINFYQKSFAFHSMRQFYTLIATFAQTPLMKIRKNIYLVLGILFLLFYIVMIVTFLTEFKAMVSPKSGGFGFFVSGQLWLVPPILFFRASYRLKKKIDRKDRELLENAFNEQGPHQ